MAIKKRKPKVVAGGKAIPIGKNYYYMKGRKHEQGGIDVGANPKTGLEVEDGEVMHVSKDNVKVFSSVPILNGKSPAEKVIEGENPNKVFKAQENFKDRNNLNDDGSRVKAMGGLSRKKDYGSSKRPYPTVERKDFAGDNRRYPIPTKKDAVDALRLAGLHGRSDVKTKVYNKYPELKKKEYGGTHKLVEISIGGKKRLIRVPSSTGVRKQAALGIDEKPNIDPNLVVTPFDKTGNLTEAETQAKDSFEHETPMFKTLTPMDYVGFGANTAGSIAGALLNKKAIKSMKYNNAPTPVSAAKFKTRININPQIDKIRETVNRYYRDVDANTASSRVALARKQRASVDALLDSNELYAKKENAETQLINQDKANQQAVNAANVQQYNRWAEGKAQFDNKKLDMLAENNISALENFNSGVQDVISRIESRKATNRNLSTIASAYPNVTAQILRDNGFEADYYVRDGETHAKARARQRKENKASRIDQRIRKRGNKKKNTKK